MKVQVRLFARAKDLVQADRVEIDLGARTTVAELRRRLGAEYPALRSLLERSALAVEAEFVGEERVLRPGDEVALLPPVSGGR